MADVARFWLMKTEPEVFSFDDLLAAPERTTAWEGVRNYQVRNLMRDEMRVGDLAFIYHSSCAVPCIAGIAQVTGAARPDPTALQKDSPYADQLSLKEGASRWLLVDVTAHQAVRRPLSLAQMRADAALAELPLLKRGNRLSIQPVPPELWQHILGLVEPLAV